MGQIPAKSSAGLVEATNSAFTGPSVGRRALVVQVVYEDKRTGLRAKRVVDRLREQLGQTVELQVSLWRFDVLKDPVLHEQAAEEAAGADILVLSARASEKLPEAVSLWLERWLSQSSDEPPALVVSLDSSAKGSAAAERLLTALKRAALPGGVEVFCHFGGGPRTDDDLTFKGIQWRAETTTAVLAETLRAAQRQTWRHWGINE